MTGEIPLDPDALAKHAEIARALGDRRPHIDEMPWTISSRAKIGQTGTVTAVYAAEADTAVLAGQGIRRPDGLAALISPVIFGFTGKEWTAFIDSAKDGEFDINKQDPADITPGPSVESTRQAAAELFASALTITVDETGHIVLPGDRQALHSGAAVMPETVALDPREAYVHDANTQLDAIERVMGGRELHVTALDWHRLDRTSRPGVINVTTTVHELDGSDYFVVICEVPANADGTPQLPADYSTLKLHAWTSDEMETFWAWEKDDDSGEPDIEKSKQTDVPDDPPQIGRYVAFTPDGYLVMMQRDVATEGATTPA